MTTEIEKQIKELKAKRPYAKGERELFPLMEQIKELEALKRYLTKGYVKRVLLEELKEVRKVCVNTTKLKRIHGKLSLNRYYIERNTLRAESRFANSIRRDDSTLSGLTSNKRLLREYEEWERKLDRIDSVIGKVEKRLNFYTSKSISYPEERVQSIKTYLKIWPCEKRLIHTVTDERIHSKITKDFPIETICFILLLIFCSLFSFKFLMFVSVLSGFALIMGLIVREFNKKTIKNP